MTPDRQHALDLMTPGQSASAPLQERLDGVIHELLASFPNPAHLSAADRRGIIARYSAVLEGNFIYWMTATYLAVESDEAHAIIEDNAILVAHHAVADAPRPQIGPIIEINALQ